MTKAEAIETLSACKLVAERLDQAVNSNSATKTQFGLSEEDRQILAGYTRVQSDPIAAGPGLFKKLLAEAQLTQVNVYRIEQLIKLVAKASTTRHENLPTRRRLL
jgi:hypothetical protein